MASRVVQGRVISRLDSTARLPGVELIFHRVSTDSLAQAWRAITGMDGRFWVALRTGSRYRVEVSCEGQHVATADLLLPGAGADSSALEHPFYVPCREPAPIADGFPPLFFATNRASLLPRAEQRLKALLRIMQENPAVVVRVEGHAAAQEADPGQSNQAGYQQRLGQQRAQAAYDYLLRHGVPGNRLSTRSHGSQRPRVTDTVSNGGEFNQRVEVLFPEPEQAPSPVATPAASYRKPSKISPSTPRTHVTTPRAKTGQRPAPKRRIPKARKI